MYSECVRRWAIETSQPMQPLPLPLIVRTVSLSQLTHRGMIMLVKVIAKTVCRVNNALRSLRSAAYLLGTLPAMRHTPKLES